MVLYLAFFWDLKTIWVAQNQEKNVQQLNLNQKKKKKKIYLTQRSTYLLCLNQVSATVFLAQFVSLNFT